MTLREFAELVRDMRMWQIFYFKSGNFGDLEKAKHLEQRVDRAAGEILWPVGEPGQPPTEEGGAG